MFTPNIPLAHHFSSLDAKHQAEFSVASLKDNNWKDQIQAEGSTASQNLTPARKLGQCHAAIDVLEARILSCTGRVARVHMFTCRWLLSRGVCRHSVTTDAHRYGSK